MIKVLVNGCNGKMGQEVIQQINNDNEFEVACGFDKEKIKEYNFNVYTDIKDIKEKIDVIIDFSVPKATMNILEFAKKNKIPIVIATTGLSKEELDTIKDNSKEIPIFQSVNMSFDISLMKKIVSEVARAIPDTDIEIIETHHNRKIDSPSGTALLLAKSINDALGNTKKYDLNRFNKREKRSKDDIGFSSIRGGNIVGEHTVSFFGEFETFEITHRAYSRGIFAKGALKGAKYIITQKNGLFTMDDIV